MRIYEEKPNKLPIENVLLTGKQFRSLSSPVVAHTPPQTGKERCPQAEKLFDRYNIHIHCTILLDLNGDLRNGIKSQLETELVRLSNNNAQKSEKPSRKLMPLSLTSWLWWEKFFKEAWALCQDILWHWFALTPILIKAWHYCDEIHIVFNHYREDIINNSKGKRRRKSKGMIVIDMISLNQNVPVVQEKVWLSTINKIVFQAFYVVWLTTDNQYAKPVYLNVHGWCRLGVLVHSL